MSEPLNVVQRDFSQEQKPYLAEVRTKLMKDGIAIFVYYLLDQVNFVAADGNSDRFFKLEGKFPGLQGHRTRADGWIHSTEVHDGASLLGGASKLTQAILDQLLVHLQQGGLGDCWVLVAIYLLRNHPELVRWVCEVDLKENQPYWTLRLKINRKWTTVYVCKYVAAKGGELAFVGNFNETFLIIALEKAFFKVLGLHNIDLGGLANEALAWLCEGFPLVDVQITPNLDLALMVNTIKNALRRGVLMSVITKASLSSKKSALFGGHAFALLKIYKVKIDGKEEYFLLMRDPHGEQLMGPFRPGTDWWKRMTGEEGVKEEMEKGLEEPGRIIVSFKFLLKYFVELEGFCLDLPPQPEKIKNPSTEVWKNRTAHFYEMLASFENPQNLAFAAPEHRNRIVVMASQIGARFEGREFEEFQLVLVEGNDTRSRSARRWESCMVAKYQVGFEIFLDKTDNLTAFIRTQSDTAHGDFAIDAYVLESQEEEQPEGLLAEEDILHYNENDDLLVAMEGTKVKDYKIKKLLKNKLACQREHSLFWGLSEKCFKEKEEEEEKEDQ